MRKRSYFKWSIVLIILVVLATVILLNRVWIYDYFRGMTYQPTNEMSSILGKLKLTGHGEFLFKASRPILESSDSFNAHCRGDGETEIAVLGCYTGGDIYIYNIEAAELDGIRELTTAHELLHAVWSRMDDAERNSLKNALSQVLEENSNYLNDEINTYNEAAKQEELYVRAGTEVKKLPEVLEKHYGEIFTDQDLVVSFYDRYITVFRWIESEMARLQSEMEDIKAQISTKTNEYEKRISQLDADIVSFNSCARVAGCFNSQWAFSERRSALVAEQGKLRGAYEEINSLVAEYNKRVEQYNNDVVYSEKLNNMINSSAKPAENI